jgi:uridylate kinase
MPSKKLIVISLGGSLIAPAIGFDIKFLKKFQSLILDFLKKDYRFILVCGGGYTARNYQVAARKIKKLENEDIDWIGIHTTRLNAHFIKILFKKFAHIFIIKNPTEKIDWTEKILIAGGWKPGFSTDYDAVCLAKNFQAEAVINLSNIDYVFDKDPRKFKNAKKITEIDWSRFRKIVGNKWIPGANLPFDPIAAKLAQDLNLKVCFIKGTNLGELQKVVEGKKFKGTVIG